MRSEGKSGKGMVTGLGEQAGSHRLMPTAPPEKAKADALKQFREFGLLVGGILVLAGLFGLHHHPALKPYCDGIGGVLVVLGLVAPKLLAKPHKAWMGLAHVMGTVMTTILLSIVFFGVMTPVATLRRLMGSDDLGLRIDKKAQSYWDMRKDARPANAQELTNQF
ncbi:MAG: SxtJ family membrane protein [Candidatus Xenobia bacterium]